MEKKRASRRTPEDAEFHSQMAEIIPLLPRTYAADALKYFPELDASKMHYAVAGRHAYPEALTAFRVVAGLVPPPPVKRLAVPNPRGARRASRVTT